MTDCLHTLVPAWGYADPDLRAARTDAAIRSDVTYTNPGLSEGLTGRDAYFTHFARPRENMPDAGGTDTVESNGFARTGGPE